MENKKFFEFKNITDNSNQLYVYGEIVGGADKWDESDVTFKDFQTALEGIKNNSTLEMYIASPGGSVFTTQSMISMLQRAKSNKNIKIVAYLDGLAASCASWLPMAADEIVVYSNSIMMVHKPMTLAWGNANELQKEIDLLNKLENDIMMPMYMKKAKNVTKEEMKEMLNNETWLTAEEIADKFNVTYIDENKEVAAKFDKNSYKNYKNMPESVKKAFTNVKNTAQNSENDKKDSMEDAKNEEMKRLVERINKKADYWQKKKY